MRRLAACIAIAAATATLVTACGTSGPPAGDVRACQMVKHDLAQPRQDASAYSVAAGIAVTAGLRQAIGFIAEDIPLQSGLFSIPANELAASAASQIAAICQEDGVNGIDHPGA